MREIRTVYWQANLTLERRCSYRKMLTGLKPALRECLLVQSCKESSQTSKIRNKLLLLAFLPLSAGTMCVCVSSSLRERCCASSSFQNPRFATLRALIDGKDGRTMHRGLVRAVSEASDIDS